MKDKNIHAGLISISIKDKKGKVKRIWQEYGFLHFFRKRFGVRLPKLFLLTGYLTKKAVYKNLLVNSGKELISHRINGLAISSYPAPRYIAIGTSASAVAPSNTQLGGEATGNGYNRMLGTLSCETTDVNEDTNQVIGTWTVTSSKAIVEMGIFNQATGGRMLVRNVFPAYTLQPGDTFQITHRLKHE